jgi:hypothetical protein
MQPPTWAHVTIFAGDLRRAFPFGFPTGGTPTPLRKGLYDAPRSRPVFLGTVRWGARTGPLVLAPDYPLGGQQADHLVFRWHDDKREYAIGLHAWDPLAQAAATLRAIVVSAGR